MLFLLTACTCWSQKYWFNEDQLRAIYQLSLERDQFQQENTTLLELVALNDSLHRATEKARKNLQGQLEKRTSQYLNAELKYDQEHEKFLLADETLKGMNRRKDIYKYTSISLAGTLLGILIFK